MNPTNESLEKDSEESTGDDCIEKQEQTSTKIMENLSSKNSFEANCKISTGNEHYKEQLRTSERDQKIKVNASGNENDLNEVSAKDINSTTSDDNVPNISTSCSNERADQDIKVNVLNEKVNNKGEDEIQQETIDSESSSQNITKDVANEDIENEDKQEDLNSDTQNSESNATNYDPKFIHYEGDVAVYEDPESGYEYVWNNDSEEWSLRNNDAYGFEDDTHTFTDKDGVKYYWDKEKSAWFPKIDDNFMAMYQLNYGFIDNTQSETKAPDVIQPETSTIELQNKSKELKRKAKDPEWFEVDDQHNTNVYVSNLPLDITEQEFVDLMQKCGLVMRDPVSGKMKIKLYLEKGTDILKGDGLCTYIKKESVDLALNLLDDYNYKGHKIKVERAKFQMKGAYDPTLKPKRKKKDKEKIKRMQEKLFDWRPEKLRGQRAKHEKVVIIKNAFEPSMFDKEVQLILEIQKDLREECSKCGEIRKVVVFDRHPEGVVQVNMKSAEEADEVVNLVNGRWYNKRQLFAETWDGKTKYRIAETDAQISKRLDKWNEFLEGEEKEKETNENTKETKTEELT